MRLARRVRLSPAGSGCLTSSRIVIVAGAGIGGLTAALALARSGFRVVVLEQAERLEETGAGIQLSPNAARTLIDLGLRTGCAHVVVPAALARAQRASGREIVRMPLGDTPRALRRAYWMIHRGDLQAALPPPSRGSSISRSSSACAWKISSPIPTASPFGARPRRPTDERGTALHRRRRPVVAGSRARIGARRPPRFAGRTAWRALVPAR
jgi:salicylate hydroxylase